MSFDHDRKAPNELLMLDEMAFVLRTQWRKGAFGSDEEGGYCLYGALNVADHGDSKWYQRKPLNFRTQAAHNIHHQIIWQVAPLRHLLFGADRAGLDFNDHPDTNLADMMHLIVTVRQHFARTYT